jgi:hypothetical protein
VVNYYSYIVRYYDGSLLLHMLTEAYLEPLHAGIPTTILWHAVTLTTAAVHKFIQELQP